VAELSLNQNESTLIEYLTGFPLVKSLLQISTSTRKSNFKPNAQSFSIKNFRFGYLQLLLSIDDIVIEFSEREPDMKQVAVNITKIDGNVKRSSPIKKARFSFVDPENIKENMEIVKIGSVNLSGRLDAQSKMKYILLVKQPKLTISKELIAVGSGLQQIHTTINNLSLYI
jgi:hypothetical protein